MNDTPNVIDQAVAASKMVFTTIEPKKLKSFLESIFSVDVTILSSHSAAEKSGSSSGIFIFDAKIGNEANAAIKKLVLRYDPQSEDRLFFEYDLDSQYKLIDRLKDTGLPIPKVYGVDPTGERLGVSGFVMDCVDGEPIPTSLFHSGPLVVASDEERLNIYRSILKTLVTLHSLDHVSLGLQDFTKDAVGNNSAEKLINWWWRTWQWTMPSSYDRLVPVKQWLLSNIPQNDNVVLMHGDPNLGNYLVKNGQVSAILDWELSSIGNPELDIAIQVLSMESHLSTADQLSVTPPTQEQWLSFFYEAGGRPVKHFDYYRKHAAYQIVICFESMCKYLPADIQGAYQQMAEFYWRVIEEN